LSAQYLSSQKSLYTTAGWLLVLESLLMFIPITVLGSAIGWPKSLGDPAAKILPLLVQNATAVRFGYLFYLGYSILFWLVAMLLIRVLERGESGSSWLRIASGFGIASAIARCLGIIRWLVAMPALATLYTDPSISTATRESIEVVYRALNDYAGSVGEVLGVSLFAALWLAIVSLKILQTGVLPRWLGFFGLVSATILALQLARLFGVELGAFISISVSFLHLWFLTMGIFLILNASRVDRESSR
jgi:hypothetical protein